MPRWINKITVSCLLFLFGIGIYYLNRIPDRTKEELFPFELCRRTKISNPDKLQYVFKYLGINYNLKDYFTADDIVNVINLLNKKAGGKLYYENTFNTLPDYYTLGIPEYEEKRGRGYRQYIFYGKPSDDLILTLKKHFGSIAVIKARLAVQPAYSSTKIRSHGNTKFLNECEGVFYGLINKYKYYNYFYLQEVIDDENHIMDLKNKYFTGMHDYGDFYLDLISCLNSDYYTSSLKRFEERENLPGNSFIRIPAHEDFPEIKDEFYLIVRADPHIAFAYPSVYLEGNHYTLHMPAEYRRTDGEVMENIPHYGLIGLDQDSAEPAKKLNDIARETCRKPYNSKGD